MAKLGWRSIISAKSFFVRWFLPVPAVERLEDHHKWDFDDDGETASPARKFESQPQAIPAPAPEVRAPEGSEDRQSRQLNTPNPFA